MARRPDKNVRQIKRTLRIILLVLWLQFGISVYIVMRGFGKADL